MTLKSLQPYLFFAGRCDEALAFYRTAIGAEVDFLLRYNESPEPPPPGVLPPGFETKVCHATVRIGEVSFMASDGCDPGLKFSGFTLSLAWETAAEAERAFGALSDGGQVQMPLSKTFWSPCFGMVTDRFGIGWMVTIVS